MWLQENWAVGWQLSQGAAGNHPDNKCCAFQSIQEGENLAHGCPGLGESSSRILRFLLSSGTSGISTSFSAMRGFPRSLLSWGGGDTSQTPPYFPFPRKTHLRLASAFSVPVTNLRTLPRTHSLKLVLAPESSGPAPSLRVAQIWHARHSVLPSQAGGTRCDPPGGQAPGHNWRFP